MGLAWQALSFAGVKPFWQSLYDGSALDEPLMAFYLTRFQNANGAKEQESGGGFTLGLSKSTSPPVVRAYHVLTTGSTNTSLHTGQIDYQDIPSTFISYWTLVIKDSTANSTLVSLPSGQSSYPATDPGTTLIGGPTAQVAAVYAQIPKSVAGTGNYGGYFLYRALLTLVLLVC